MNIALWAPFLNKEISGFEDFIVETIPHIIVLHPDDKFFILTDAVPVRPAFPANTEITITKPFRQNPLIKKIWWNVNLPAVLKKIKADLFISFTGDCSLTAATPQVIVINHAEKLRSSFIKKAQLIFVTSESIKTHLIITHKTSREKISVIYPAPGRHYLPVDANKKDDIKKEYSEGREYFLYNGGFKKQGELIDLLKSFSHFKKRQQTSFKLLLLGESRPSFSKDLSAYKYRDDVKFIGTKDKNIQAAITAAAYAVVLPFNTSDDMIAALNAMRSAVPVIATKSSAINEVAGDAAIYAENETKDIGEKMIQLYTNENFRNGLIEKGAERMKGFTHERVAGSLWQSIMRSIK